MGILPKEKTKPIHELAKQIITIYGAPKIGKTTFCAAMESPLFIATEPGQNALEVYKVDCNDWPVFLETCAELTKDHNGFKTVIIDTIDNLYGQCEDFMLKKLNIIHPSDLEYGKGFSIVQAEFGRVIKKLSLLPFGLVFISHSKEKEVSTRTGKIQKTTPAMPPGASKIITALSDMILLFDSERGKTPEDPERRIIRARASKNFDAGSRWELPETIPMDFKKFQAIYEKGENNVKK